MRPQYICKGCGYIWRDVILEKNESNYFLRCIRCESRNIFFPQKEHWYNSDCFIELNVSVVVLVPLGVLAFIIINVES